MADKITAQDLKTRKDEFVIIDVREADEIDSGKIFLIPSLSNLN